MGLNITLKSQEHTFKKYNAAFWGCVAAMLLGIAVAVIGLIFAAPTGVIVAAGALFVAGLVSMVVMGFLMKDLAGKISETKGQIDVCTTAMAQLSNIVDTYKNMDDMYKDMNAFWGRLYTDTNSLIDADDTTAQQIGEGVLADRSYIKSAKATTKDIQDATELYLYTLNKQGILIPPPAKLMSAMSASSPSTLQAMLLTCAHYDLGVESCMEKARECLSRGKFPSYRIAMEKACALEAQKASMDKVGLLKTGRWYDIARLSSAARLFHGIKHGAGPGQNDPGFNALINRINTATAVLPAMLNKIISVCNSAQELSQRYELLSKASTPQVAKIRGLTEGPLEDLLRMCEEGLSWTTQSNNAFVDVNHCATDYYQNVQRNMNSLLEQVKIIRAKAKAQKDHIYIPWYK